MSSVIKLKIMTVAFGVVSLAGCELSQQDQAVLDAAFNPEFPNPSDYPVPPVAPACFNERFVQPQAEITKKIDILFVADTSGSIVEERGAIADGIDAFVQELPADVDYRIGVMLAHGSQSSWSGRLYKKGSATPRVLDSRTLSLEQIRTLLRKNLTDPATDMASDGGEEGMYSLLRGLDPDRLAESQSYGFFRSDAALAVVFVADENDICARYPAGVMPVPDGELREGPAFDRDCTHVTPEAVLSKLREIKGDLPLLVSGIVYSDLATVPWGGENEYGYGYMETIRLASGVTVDMASGDYDGGLSKIGALATVKLFLLTEFTLARRDIEPATIQVQVDGVGAPYVYNSDVNEVFLPEPGTALSTVDINYCLKMTSGGSGGDPSGGGSGGNGSSGEPPTCTGLDCGVFGI